MNPFMNTELAPVETDKRQDLEALELLIDRYGLDDVVDMLSDIAAEKADHIATNWQDGKLANRWSTACQKLSRTAAAIHKLALAL